MGCAHSDAQLCTQGQSLLMGFMVSERYYVRTMGSSCGVPEEVGFGSVETDKIVQKLRRRQRVW